MIVYKSNCKTNTLFWVGKYRGFIPGSLIALLCLQLFLSPACPEHTRPVNFPAQKAREVLDDLEKSGEEPKRPSSIEPEEDFETVPQQGE